MREGMYLGAPPVRLWKVGAGATLHGLTRGVSTYSEAAGGFDQVRALPQLQRLRGPLVPVERDARLVELYAQQPGTFHKRLQQMFVARRPVGT